MKICHAKCKEELQIAVIKVSCTNLWGLCTTLLNYQVNCVCIWVKRFFCFIDWTDVVYNNLPEKLLLHLL